MRRNFIAAALMMLCATSAGASDVSSWSGSASQNTVPPPNGVPENIAPSRVAPTIREVMAAVARWYGHANAISSTGIGNAQVLTYTPPVTACVRGEMYSFFPIATNTGPTTLTVGSCSGSVRIGTSELVGGEIVGDRVAMVFYDGAAFQLMSGGGGPGGGVTPPTLAALALNGGGCLALNGGGCLGISP